MVALFFAALTLGMLGSFHCIGMCGPLAFSLPLANKGNLAKFTGSFLYNIGRISSYAALGVLFGLAGKSFSLFGLQQALSISLGIIILFLLLIPRRWKVNNPGTNIIFIFSGKLRTMLGRLFYKTGYRSLITIGLLNGLLPCGLVYMAITAAIAAADPFKSAFFMVAFGLGTLPVMWSVSFFGNYISIGLRQKIRSAYPVILVLMACLLIVRGMGLGIPYVSPAVNNNNAEMQVCDPAVQNVNHELK